MKLSKKNRLTALLLAREAIKSIRAEGFGLSDQGLMFATHDADNTLRQLIFIMKRREGKKETA